MQVLELLFVRVAWFWNFKIPFKSIRLLFKITILHKLIQIYIFQNTRKFKIKVCFELLLERVEGIKYKELLNKNMPKKPAVFHFH